MTTMPEQNSVAATIQKRSIRSTPERLERVLDDLDANDSGRFEETHQWQRYRYRHASMTVYVKQPGDASASCCKVYSRNLSSMGIAFLFGGFVHNGSVCVVQLITLHGCWNDVVGQVVHCRHVDAHLHEVSVKFDQEIDPSFYVVEAAPCRVLLADDDPLVVRLASFHLVALNAQVAHAADSADAVQIALHKAYDLVLLGTRTPSVDNLEAVALLRAKGYLGPVAAITGALTPEEGTKLLKGGFNYYLTKPLSREDLCQLLKAIREEPLQSRYHNDPSFAELINAFMTVLLPAIRSLETALVEQNRADLTTVARMLKENASGYGFGVITEAATELESGLHAGMIVPELQYAVERVLKLCRRAQGVKLNANRTASKPAAASA